jgi:flagellar motor switch/type III secretory pathway protein FliN
MQAKSWTNPTPFTAEYLRGRVQGKDEALKPFSEVLESCAAALQLAFQSVTSLVVKCTFSEGTLGRFPNQIFEQACLVYQSGGKLFRVAPILDNHVMHLLCDVALGGNASKPAAIEEARPQSRFETLLGRHVMEVLGNELAVAMAKIMGEDLELLDLNKVPKDDAQNEPVNCIIAKFLVNVASLSAELAVKFSQSDLERLLRIKSVGKETSDQQLSDVMGNCPFTLTALLPPDEIEVGMIMALQPGSILRFGSGPSEFASLSMEGMTIATAKLEMGTDKLSLVVV